MISANAYEIEKQVHYQLGTYRQLATMFAETVREYKNANDEYERDWQLTRLGLLAEQFEQTKQKLEG